ncbi:S8 family serine peptidase [Paenibacillus sp. NPDC058071]|uniref:S8 family peptidase n=1 Tax=Paenibacillus sp. NPDC058071 TaxID=3346326 RepID=UPI0036DC8DC0
MTNRRYNIIIAACLVAVLLCGSIPFSASMAASAAEEQTEAALLEMACKEEPQPHGWLLKWHDPAEAHELIGTQVIRRQHETAVWLVQPEEADADLCAWLGRLHSESGVEYVEPNGRVSILALPETNEQSGAAAQADESASKAQALAPAASEANDPELGKQNHLRQIGAIEAWKTAHDQTDLTIAVIDTGIDLDHPDLKDNLVPGTNLVQHGKQPDDDNGHGTSVAGVLAAVGNNGKGVSGVLWKAKLMPIKALDYRGDGTEQDLGEAILYAVRKEAKIIVLSVGLYRYSPYMRDIVEYAESKGVLLVAAAGNDGLSLGEKTAVKYPAAYSTVLAVGGVRPDNKPDPRSNSGPEIDLAAPWNVFTTAIGGRYKKEEGTSMAAPQVAAAAALIWARYPNMKPYQVRELLRQTTNDTGTPGFDNRTGYGLLRVDRALKTALSPDRFEPNDKASQAAFLPLDKQVPAVFGKNGDKDWYAVKAPYDGKLTVAYEALVPSGRTAPPIKVSYYKNNKLVQADETKLGSKTFEFSVGAGRQLLLIEPLNLDFKTDTPYLIEVSFRMAADVHEPNDKSIQAFLLQPKSQSVYGTFHQTADQDWYAIQFTSGGTLRARLSTNTVRIDPALAIQRAGQQLIVYDDLHEGETEQSPLLTVTPGRYYFRVHNAISSEASPVTGTYTLKLEYTPKYDDPNEPNDKYYEALSVSPGTEYIGLIGKSGDVDWFQLRLSRQSFVDMKLTGVPAGVRMRMEVYDKKQKQLFVQSSDDKGSAALTSKLFQPGVYYVKLTSNRPFDQQYYRFRVDTNELVAGFRDIGDHWARDAVVQLSSSGIASGTGKYAFEPDRSITRAEAVAMAVKAYEPSSVSTASGSPFTDMDAKHWAYPAVRKANANGWVKGFPDQQFQPDRPVTRAEMAVMIGYAEGLKPIEPSTSPFSDVHRTHWAAPMLYAMQKKGYVNGRKGNRYAPGDKASRAEYAMLLYRVYGKR